MNEYWMNMNEHKWTWMIMINEWMNENKWTLNKINNNGWKWKNNNEHGRQYMKLN